MNKDVVTIHEKTVACDGENHKHKDDTADSGHPKIYLNIGDDDSVTCPYCGRKFVRAA